MTQISLSDSYIYCQKLAKKSARNFYYSFLGLPKEQFQAMCVLYAYMRTVDDLGDQSDRLVAEREDSLKQWRTALQQYLDKKQNQWDPVYDPCFPALLNIIQRYAIPTEYFFDVITGVESDLHHVEFQTFEELTHYCYQVAGVVGLCCIHIWGFHDDRAFETGIECGLAFQLTNILRDLSEDAGMGRIYLPQEDLVRFGYSQSDIQSQVYDERFRNLMQFEVKRTKALYQNSEKMFGYLSAEGQGILKAMYRLYSGILDEIERSEYDVYSSRAKLPRWRKLLIAGEAIVSSRWRFSRANK